MQTADVVVIGGGIVGASVAFGLANLGLKPLLLDEGDNAFRASRGNFGLVWVQGKGLDCPEYAQWSRHSAGLWPGFARDLHERTGVDTGYERPGGVLLHMSAEEAHRSEAALAEIRRQCGDRPYEYEILDRMQLAEMLPGLGPTVYNGAYSPREGHVNPLYLMRALHTAMLGLGGAYRPDHRVDRIAREAGGYVVHSSGGMFSTARVVICAGLDTRRLAAQVGLDAPVRAIAGQVAVSERAAVTLPMPTNLVRQTREGSLMVGFTVDDLGLDTTTRVDRTRNIAALAVRAFPWLGDLRLVRSWACLRIMTGDGFPIYDEAPGFPGVHVVTCHSGITLAAAHALEIAPWIAGRSPAAGQERFSTGRFDVQAHR